MLDPGAQRSGRTAAGFSLVEMVIVLGLAVTVVASVALVEQANTRAYTTGMLSADLEARTAATMGRLVEELSTAGRETLVPAPQPEVGGHVLSYLQATGAVGNEVIWSGLRRIELQYEIGELNDGLDNNGNGLVDEGRVVLIEDVGGPDERRHVLSRWVREYLEGEEGNGLDDNGNGLVDERGFVYEGIGESLILRVTLERPQPDGGGRLLTRSANTCVRPRN